ncbi:MAG: NTP transferase domain-containing protein [Caldicoprobacterales bacterium]|jgi:molybdopterin-guanine dinucleotide biosynthesis protein A|nr:NTP transferase domain-containing protein [Clostridiales bacterium]
MTGINAVVLAGDSKRGSVQEGVDNKSFLLINGKPMVEYVIDALRESSAINEISITGPSDLLKKHLGGKVDHYVEDRGSLFDNVKAGIAPFANDRAVLIVTSDIPMITGWMITDFIQRCMHQGGDFCYPIVEKRLNEERFPGVERTYVRLKDGTYTGGNVLFLNPAVIGPCEEFAKKVIAFRKQPLKTGRMLGVKFLAGLMLGILTVPKVEERFCKLLDLQASAIIVPYPEIGNDVDKPSDLDMVLEYFRTQSA